MCFDKKLYIVCNNEPQNRANQTYTNSIRYLVRAQQKFSLSCQDSQKEHEINKSRLVEKENYFNI